MNQFRKEEEEQIPEDKVPYVKEKKNSSRSFLGLLFTTEWMSREKAIELMPFILFLAGCAMLYIGNRHFAERNIRTSDKINKQLKELRYEYMTDKAELMFHSKQTEVAKQAAMLGIKESVVPPLKIVVK